MLIIYLTIPCVNFKGIKYLDNKNTDACNRPDKELLCFYMILRSRSTVEVGGQIAVQ